MRIEFIKKTDKYPVGAVVELRDDEAEAHIKAQEARLAGRRTVSSKTTPTPSKPKTDQGA